MLKKEQEVDSKPRTWAEVSAAFSPEVKAALVKMCKVVGIAPEDVPDWGATSNWYWTHTWTVKQENKFRDWLVKRLTSSAKYRRAFGCAYTNSKKRLEQAAKFFVWNYGWKLSDDDCEIYPDRIAGRI